MGSLFRHTGVQHEDTESRVLIERLLNTVQAATFEMETLCRLAGIKASREIPTAAVEVGFRSRLLLNPDFVGQYCERDEHLFLLVMHELYHVILAHTQLYSRPTLAHNIAFDAIINAGLSRQFNRPEYRGFFEVLNKADEFPGCLLRPPEGWPYHPQYPNIAEPQGANDILRRLYPPAPFGRWQPPLYEDILNLLKRYIQEKIAKGEIVLTPFMLGDHDENPKDGRAVADEFFGDVVRRVSEHWPPAPFMSRQRGGGDNMSEWMSGIGTPAEEARRAFTMLLQRALALPTGTQQRRARTPVPGITGMGVLPNPRDRHAPARTKLNVQGLLWVQPGIVRARAAIPKHRAFIYLDVSGSMNTLLPHLMGLLIPFVKRGDAAVFQFSTKVEPVTLDALKAGKVRTTQGTDIACVVKHLLETEPVVHRALILTDGFTGIPRPEAVRRLREQRTVVHVVLPTGNTTKADLEHLARTITVLPPHQPQPRWTPGL
ncbi:MAG: VWA domain-containing protein [bacterium]|nr:VWA domain-containing protein [bacterium]